VTSVATHLNRLFQKREPLLVFGFEMGLY